MTQAADCVERVLQFRQRCPGAEFDLAPNLFTARVPGRDEPFRSMSLCKLMDTVEAGQPGKRWPMAPRLAAVAPAGRRVEGRRPGMVSRDAGASSCPRVAGHRGASPARGLAGFPGWRAVAGDLAPGLPASQRLRCPVGPAIALRVEPARLRAIVARWRQAGYAETGRPGPGPAWCWLMAAGMHAAGLGYPAGPPRLARLDHLRAVIAARLWFQSSPAWEQHRAWWQSERRIRRTGPAAGTHRPDAEIHWPSITASPHAGLLWAVEIELTPKHADRTAANMAELAAPAGYAHVYYLTAPAARGVVARCADALPGDAPARVTVWDLRPTARTPGT